MPPPANSSRVVLSGKLAGGEIWSTGFWITGADITSQGDATAQAQLLLEALGDADASGAMTITLNDWMANSCTWDRVTVYAYAGGSSQSEYIGEAVNTPTKQGGLGQRVPNQVAMVLSLRTGRPGRRYRGRMYLPAGGITLNSDGEIGSNSMQPVLDGWTVFFSRWNQGQAGQIVVMSTTGSVVTPVTSLILDSRPDIQRRRANRQTITLTLTEALTA